MKRFAVLGAAIAVALIVVSVTSMAHEPISEPIGVMYQYDGMPHGVLSVANAQGRLMKVLDSENNLVFKGKIPVEHFEVMVPNSGPRAEGVILRVWFNGGLLLTIDRDEDWIWE